MGGVVLVMKRKNFEISLKKGRIGEDIVRRVLEQDRFVVYQPVTTGAHAFDMLAVKDKDYTIAVDVKTKPRRKYYRDTGINEDHYIIYKKFQDEHNIDFIIVFVDEVEKKIYGQTLNELDKPIYKEGHWYPWMQTTGGGKTIRYWHLDSMYVIGDVADNEAENLCELAQRNYEYCA